MSKRNVAVVCLVALTMILGSGMAANAGIIDPCLTYWVLSVPPVSDPPVDWGTVPPSAPAPLFVCPEGDTGSFLEQGWYIFICVRDLADDPIENVPPTDFWLIDCDPLEDAALCGGSASSGADSLTNALGVTTMSAGTLTGGGCVNGMAVVVQGFVVLDPQNCTDPFCCPIWLRSPDTNGDLIVNLVDLSNFASGYPPQAFDTCSDMNVDGIINLQDLSRFAFHFGPPGHVCN